MYDLQGAKLLEVFELLGDSVATALRILKSKLPTRVVVEPDDQEQVLDKRPYPETPVFSLMKRDALFAVGSFRFHDSGRININVPRAGG